MTKFNHILCIPIVINNQEASYAQYKQMHLADSLQLLVMSLFQYLIMLSMVEATALFVDLDFLEPNCDLNVSRHTTNFIAIISSVLQTH
jgi:hypothetical protein